jgi:hypothetical protein
MRRFALLLVLVPLAAACGGGGSKKTQPTTPTAEHADPGRTAALALFRAAVKDDRKALWDVLSKESQKRLGGYDTFKSQGAVSMERALAPLANKDLTPFISQSLSQQFGVVAVRSGERALAFPLRHEDGAWKIETPGPLTFQILGPTPGSTGSVSQVAVEVHSPGVVGDAVVWVDGKLVRPTLAPAQGKATVFANLARPLPRGVHIAVVYAEEGDDASAEAWTFSASG